MIKLGTNYLSEIKELFEENKIDFINYFKLFSINDNLDALDWCNSKRWLMFHGVCGKAVSSFGDKDLIKRIDVEKTKKILEESGTPYLSGHIYSASQEQTEEETYEAIKNNIADLKREFGMQIAIENVPYRKKYKHCEYLLKPEVINKIVHDNDVWFLFDISHARKSAEHFNMTLEEYVSKLPMDRVVEFHLAGMYDFPDISSEIIKKQYTERQIRFIKAATELYGERYDNHGILNEEDYAFLENYIPRYETLKYITLEYGSANTIKGFEDDEYTYPIANFGKINPKIKEELLEQLTRLKQIINKV